MDPRLGRTITTIDEGAWMCLDPVKYPNAIYDDHTGEWISDAETAEVLYPLMPQGHLMVCRAKRLLFASSRRGACPSVISVLS